MNIENIRRTARRWQIEEMKARNFRASIIAVAEDDHAYVTKLEDLVDDFCGKMVIDTPYLQEWMRRAKEIRTGNPQENGPRIQQIATGVDAKGMGF